MRALTSRDYQEIRDHFPLESCLKPPDLAVSAEAAQDFDRLFDAACSQDHPVDIDYTLPHPKYLFLEHITSTRGLMLHGSVTRSIDMLRPIRQTTDSSEFGNLDAIYATQDAHWALFFSVMDRTGFLGTSNGAFWLVDEAGNMIRRYYFALEVSHLRRSPWTPGAIYILPGAGFEPDPEMVGVTAGPYTIQATHWIHRGEVRPLARLNVEPEDFPFLHSVWGYDPEALGRRMSAESVAGFPFLEDPEIYPIIPPR